MIEASGKVAAFTMCAKNYLGLAKLVEATLLKHNLNIDFYIFIIDEIDTDFKLTITGNNVFEAKSTLNISEKQWNDMSFKYEITEFCTSMKPFCFEYAFENLHADKCFYIDPDMMVFNSLESLVKILDKYTFLLTPHIVTLEVNYSGSMNERNLLYSGMFNLGFIGIAKNTKSNQMLKWWQKRLEDRCFQNMMENYFTDQKWIDFIPCFYRDETFISSDLGLNIGPWNFHEREVINKDGNLYVKNRILQNSNLYKLLIVHFSGFNYSEMLGNNVSHNNISNLPEYPDLKMVYSLYAESLRSSDFLKYSESKYTYFSFDNGVLISNIHRKFYRRLSEDGKVFDNLFKSEGDFYKLLSKKSLVSNKLKSADKIALANVKDMGNKVAAINFLFLILYRIIGSSLYFTIARTLRLYSIIENHVFIIDKDYMKNPKLRN